MLRRNYSGRNMFREQNKLATLYVEKILLCGQQVGYIKFLEKLIYPIVCHPVCSTYTRFSYSRFLFITSWRAHILRFRPKLSARHASTRPAYLILRVYHVETMVEKSC